jgi:non-homologous end joining protein Ku
MRMIQAKHEGIELERAVAMPPREVPDLIEALKASIAEKRKA